MSDLAGLSLADAARLVNDRQVKATELVAACLAHIDQWEPHIRALVTLLDEPAMAEAHRLDEESASSATRRPLHGVPVMVKDLIDVGGVATEAGSQILSGNVAQADAPVVARLKEAGAIILGKTNTHEFAYGALTPPTRNPWNRGRMPGGSSGGSAAAVSAGETFGALGTDTAASIREPSALCGIVGLKPTYGRVSCERVIPLAWSLDTVGPMARNVEDCALLLDAIADSKPRDPTAMASADPAFAISSLGAVRVAVATELMQPLESEISRALDDLLGALSDAGSSIVEVSIGHPDELIATIFVILAAEATAYHRPWLEESPELYGSDVLTYLEMGATFAAVDYIDAQRVRMIQRRQVDQALQSVDVLLAPSHQVVAPAVDTDTVMFPDGVTAPRDLTLIRPLAPFSLTGHPALTLPLRLSADEGLPIGVQLVGRRWGDERLLRIGSAVEQLSEWGAASPPPPTGSA